MADEAGGDQLRREDPSLIEKEPQVLEFGREIEVEDPDQAGSSRRNQRFVIVGLHENGFVDGSGIRNDSDDMPDLTVPGTILTNHIKTILPKLWSVDKVIDGIARSGGFGGNMPPAVADFLRDAAKAPPIPFTPKTQ
jgi:hypothetical protein